MVFLFNSMIIVSRTSQLSNKFVPLSLYIDGVKVGSLSDGERSEFRIAPGLHTMQAKVNISASNEVQFEVKENKNIEFELGSNINVMKNVLLAISHPLLLFALFMLDKIIKWDFFLVFGLLTFLIYEAWLYFERRRKARVAPEIEKYYLYLTQVN